MLDGYSTNRLVGRVNLVSADSTKIRIIAAATQEFAAHGLAGARVDRIAMTAGANKERLYAYFGNKERLFGTVLRQTLSRSDAWVPERAEDLGEATGELFDLAFRRPELVRLLAWWRLEGARVELSPDDLEPYRHKIDEIAAAQRSGLIDKRWDPADLLAIVGALATAWTDAPDPLVRIAETDGSPGRDRRAAIEEAVRRITGPIH